MANNSSISSDSEERKHITCGDCDCYIGYSAIWNTTVCLPNGYGIRCLCNPSQDASKKICFTNSSKQNNEREH